MDFFYSPKNGRRPLALTWPLSLASKLGVRQRKRGFCRASYHMWWTEKSENPSSSSWASVNNYLSFSRRTVCRESIVRGLSGVRVGFTITNTDVRFHKQLRDGFKNLSKDSFLLFWKWPALWNPLDSRSSLSDIKMRGSGPPIPPKFKEILFETSEYPVWTDLNQTQTRGKPPLDSWNTSVFGGMDVSPSCHLCLVVKSIGRTWDSSPQNIVSWTTLKK